VEVVLRMVTPGRRNKSLLFNQSLDRALMKRVFFPFYPLS
jgi:hypothetical protein